MSVGMKRWSLRLASIAALGIGLVAGSAGDFAMNYAEAASPEDYRCGQPNRFEKPAFGYPGFTTPGTLDEATNRDQSFERALVLCGDPTVCGEFSDSVRHFQVPMALWNGTDSCGFGEFGLPSL